MDFVKRKDDYRPFYIRHPYVPTVISVIALLAVLTKEFLIGTP